jgi:hypothetical protein
VLDPQFAGLGAVTSVKLIAFVAVVVPASRSVAVASMRTGVPSYV